MKIRNTLWWWALAALALAHPVGAIEKISLHALFKDKAIVLIDGARRVLKAGETSPEGVKLVSTDTQAEQAEIEVDGKRQQLTLGVVISSFASSAKASVTLYPDQGGHFFTDGLINDVAVRFLVDTGATSIAMNSSTAAQVGIDYKRNGRAGVAGTAGGMVRTYNVKLQTVQVGEIKFFNVDAAVIEGTGPSEVLLGMSFLNRVDMKRDGDHMELTQRY